MWLWAVISLTMCTRCLLYQTGNDWSPTWESSEHPTIPYSLNYVSCMQFLLLWCCGVHFGLPTLQSVVGCSELCQFTHSACCIIQHLFHIRTTMSASLWEQVVAFFSCYRFRGELNTWLVAFMGNFRYEYITGNMYMYVHCIMVHSSTSPEHCLLPGEWHPQKGWSEGTLFGGWKTGRHLHT